MPSAPAAAALHVALGTAAAGLCGLAWYLWKSRRMVSAVKGLRFLERDILEYAISHSKAGDATSAFESIDYFCYNFGWAMNTGDKKGVIVDKVVEERKPKLVLELGGYVGYSAIRFGEKQRQVADEAAVLLYISVEKDPLMAAIATKLIEHAGLGTNVKVLIGTLATCAESISALVRQHVGAPPGEAITFDMIYIDHWKDQYVPDFELLERLGFIGPGTVVVADNIIVPGAPEYLKLLTEDRKDQYDSTLMESTLEYSNDRDTVLVSVRK